jgi:hypothetical protein
VPAINNTTTTSQFTGVSIKEIDFIERFQSNWNALIEILGIMRPIRKAPGTKLVSSRASITLQNGTVEEGAEVPLSLATVVPVAYEDLALLKYRKAVTAEAVTKYGAAIAVQKTDDALLNELQGNVLDDFYTFAQSGTLTAAYSTFQMAVSMAVSLVKDKFKKMRRDYSNIVAFVNTLDVGEYLGGAALGQAYKPQQQMLRAYKVLSQSLCFLSCPFNRIFCSGAQALNGYTGAAHAAAAHDDAF